MTQVPHHAPAPHHAPEPDVDGSHIALVVHPERDDAAATARQLAEWLRARGHSLALSEHDAGLVAMPDAAVDDSDLGAGACLAVCVGGDGTMLHTVSLVAQHGVPVLGVNSGRLGYLTEVERDGAEAALERFFEGDHRVETRMRIEFVVRRRGGELVGPWTALNEGVIEKRAQGHTVRLAVDLDGERFTSYSADGLIVATATGSTAYSLSARGPILDPELRALLFTPVSPHMLFDRSLVLDPASEVAIHVVGDRAATLSVDGRATETLHDGDTVVATESPVEARLVTFDTRSFHAVLKSKFGLREHAPGEED